MRVLGLLCLVLAGGQAAGLQELYQQWKLHHGMAYTRQEDAARFKNFVAHVERFHVRGMPNSLAALSEEEFRGYNGGGGASSGLPLAVHDVDEKYLHKTYKAPASFNWVDHPGVIASVKDQGSCGSCWAFSAVGSIEAQWGIAGHPLVNLSQQYFVSCETKDQDGCNGGWPYRAMEYAAQTGVPTLDSYPYVSQNGTNPSCQHSYTLATANVTGYTSLPHSETQMAAILAASGPISVCLYADDTVWWPYTGGIMSNCPQKPTTHCVLIVGYGSSNGEDYWLIKNSWGTGWGENGYLRLQRGSNQCDITVVPIQATVGL
eukprot:TRINITY_DN29499_c0_g1_i1.p1 TRINITY_DN29499_c0_g1~~TRINITY_DN29499_c0_g1_i1.p1  ORF type:complete len:318 (+),score=78.59 TRINITY_DN29499_c0_g1_i1:43-996(+)